MATVLPLAHPIVDITRILSVTKSSGTSKSWSIWLQAPLLGKLKPTCFLGIKAKLDCWARLSYLMIYLNVLFLPIHITPTNYGCWDCNFRVSILVSSSIQTNRNSGSPLLGDLLKEFEVPVKSPWVLTLSEGGTGLTTDPLESTLNEAENKGPLSGFKGQ